jgi:ankyrin repeat protein
VSCLFFLFSPAFGTLLAETFRFRWVSCQLDHLCELSTDAQRRKALHELPKTLNETYERILGRVKPHDIPLVRRVLLWTTYASPPLEISALLDVVSIEEDDDRIDPEARVDEEQVLQFCSSLIRKRYGRFELAHFSVQEYLEKIGDVNLIDYQYHTNPRLHLAKACLRFLCLSDFDRPPPVTVDEMEEIAPQHSFLKSATMTWLKYADSHLEDVGLYAQIQCLFQPKRSYNFLIYAVVMLYGLLEQYYDSWEDEAEFHTDLQKTIEMATSGDFGPLHVAASLGLTEICEWLLAEGCDVNQGSPFGLPIECSVFGSFFSVWRHLGNRDDVDFELLDDSVDEMGTGMQEKTIVALLSAGGDCKMTASGSIPLCSAGLSISISKNNGPLFSILVEHGMPIQLDTMQDLQSIDDKNILEPLLQVIQDVKDLSITTEQRDEIRNLGIQKGIGTVSSLLRGESTSLEQLSNLAKHAISYDQLDIIQPLFEHPAFAIDMELPGIDGTILHFAARRHSVKVLHALLDLGFDPSRLDSDGRTVLQESATLQNDSIMRRLVENPKCIRPDNDGRTVWHEAARSGTSRTLELLIEEYGTSCPDMHLVSVHGRTPLLEAVISGNETTSLLLLDLSQENDRAVMDWKLGHYCVSHGLSKVLHKLIQSGVNLAPHSETQQSALHFLTERTPIPLLESLLENGMDPDEQDLNGKSAIHTFLDGSRHTELAWAELGLGMGVDYLPSEILEKLVTPEGAVLKDRDGFVPWYYYCTKYVTRVLAVCTHVEHWYPFVSQDTSKALAGFEDVSQELVKKGALAGFDGENKIQSAFSLLVENCLNTATQPPKVGPTLQATFNAIANLLVRILDNLALSSPATGCVQLTRLLIWAIQNREDVLSKALLDYGVDVHARSNFYDGRNAIEMVCFITNVGQDMFETVLKYAKVDALNEKDWAGKSPIHYLCEQAQIDQKDRKEFLGKLNILLKFEVDPNARRRVDGRTPVDIVALNGDVEAFRCLMQHRASVRLYNQYGWGVVVNAILSDSINMVNELVKQIDDSEQWKRRINRSAPWNGNLNLSGCSAFHLAATVSKDMLEILVGSGHYEDIHKTNDAGYTPLHLASASHHGATTEWLISHGADLNAATTDGMTALHFAVSSGNLSSVEALVKAGALFTADKMGRTPESVVPAHLLTEVLHLLQNLKVSDHVLQNLRRYQDTQDVFSAIRSGHLDSCRMIMEKDISWKTARSPECNTCTALGLALIEEKWDIVDLLIENGVSLNEPVCASHFPCIYPYMPVVHVAVAKPGCNSRLQKSLEISLTQQDHWVWGSLTPFHVAAYYNPPSIDILISHVRKNQDILM